MAGLINKESHNTIKCKSGSSTFLEEDYLDKDVSILLLNPAPKIQNFQVYQHYDVAIFGAKSQRAQYENGQRGREDGKSKRGGEDREVERSGEGY